MNEDQRQVLAQLAASALRTRFGGNKKAAYTAIGINPATFDRALGALPIRDDRANRILSELAPGAQGNIDNVRPDPSRADTFVITTPKRTPTPQEALRRRSVEWIAQNPDTFPERVADWLQDLELRVDALERVAQGRLSAVPDTTEISVKAAHHDEVPIGRGQGHDDHA